MSTTPRDADGLPLMRWNIAIKRNQQPYERKCIIECLVNGVPFRRLKDDESTRELWTDGRVIIKFDAGGLAQAQREAEMWLRLPVEDRIYFATPLQVGRVNTDGTEYIIQEYVPLLKPDYDTAVRDYQDMIDHARKLWQYMGWDFGGPFVQYGIDERLGLLCIHDYPIHRKDLIYHEWTTI